MIAVTDAATPDLVAPTDVQAERGAFHVFHGAVLPTP